MDRFKIADRRESSERFMHAIANCFYIIACLSLFGTIFTLGQLEYYFVYFLFGLGITQFVDGTTLQVLVPMMGGAGYAVGIVVDIVIVGIFILMGILGGAKKAWPFVAGTILYALDTLIFIAIGDFLSVFFHILMLLVLPWGVVAVRNLKNSELALAEMDKD